MASIIRKIDDLGRVSIPKEVRKTLGWFSGDEIEMNFKDDTIILHKYLPEYSDYITHIKEMIIIDPEVENKSEVLAALDTALAELKN